jgi:hypothetical protein
LKSTREYVLRRYEMTAYTVTISDGGVTVYRTVMAATIEAAIDVIEADIRNAEEVYDKCDQRTRWNGAIVDGTAMYRLHDGGQDSASACRVTIWGFHRVDRNAVIAGLVARYEGEREL